MKAQRRGGKEGYGKDERSEGVRTGRDEDRDGTGRSKVGQIWRCDVTHARVGPADQSHIGGLGGMRLLWKTPDPKRPRSSFYCSYPSCLTPTFVPPPPTNVSPRQSLSAAKEDVSPELFSDVCEHQTLPLQPGLISVCVSMCVTVCV